MRTVIILVLALLSLASAASAHADWLPVLAGQVSRVVAAGRTAAAIRAQEVLFLRDDGQVLGRLAEDQPASPASTGRSFKTAAEQTLDRLEIPEIDRDTDYTDDLVDDESRLADRRSWRTRQQGTPASPDVVPSATPALSAGADEIWVANDRGIYRVNDDGAVVLTFGREWTGPSIAAADREILVGRGDSLVLLSTTDAEPRVVRLSAPAEHLAISPTGHRMAWATGASIHLVGSSGGAVFDAPSVVRQLVFCGETAVAVVASGLLAVPTEGRPDVRAAPADIHKVVCPRGPGLPWFAVGGGLWISSDQGRRWSEVPVPQGQPLFDVAVSENHVWLATGAGLYISVDERVASEGKPAPARVHRSQPSAWLAWLAPKVSLRAAATFATAGHRIEGFAFAAIPLGSPAIPQAMSPPEGTSPTAEPAHASLAIDTRDADANCLAVARRKAVELAMTEPERAQSYVARAGRAAWLPELRFLVSRRYGRSESLDVTSSSSSTSAPFGIDTVDDMRYEARATWDLARLVFSSEELAAQAQALHMAQLRRDIESTMNRLYFERRRLIIAPTAEHEVRAQELKAELDSLSAGAFSACISDMSTGAR